MPETHYQRMSRLIHRLQAIDAARNKARQALIDANPPPHVLERMRERERITGAQRVLDDQAMEKVVAKFAVLYNITYSPDATIYDKLLIAAAVKDEHEGRS